MTPAQNTDYVGHDSYADVQWVATHGTFLAFLVLVVAVLAALWLFAPPLIDGSDRWAQALAQVVGNACRAVVAWFTRTGTGGAHAAPRLAITAEPYRPDGDPAEAGEDEEPSDDPDSEPEPVEAYDPLTSPIAITDAPVPLYASLPPVERPAWDVDFTGAWRAIDTSRVPDPGEAYSPWDNSQHLPVLPTAEVEPETAGVR